MYETDSVPAHWVDLCNDENLVDEVRQTVPLPFSPVCSTVTVCFPRHAHCLGPDLIDGCATSAPTRRCCVWQRHAVQSTDRTHLLARATTVGVGAVAFQRLDIRTGRRQP
jgi:hypothetical protein